jgi:acyl-coenzyme A synthetase/AMP-(fatty) acid ligase
MQDIHSLFSIERPEKRPVFHDGVSFKRWREFAAEVGFLADILQKRPERRWLLESEDAGEFLIQLLALLYSGKQVVIPPNTQAGTIEQMNSEVEARFSAIEWKAAAREAAAAAATPLLPTINPHAARIDLYTSGSTGKPKQVRKTLADFECEVRILESMWASELGTLSVIATVPHQHMYGLVYRLLWPLCSGRIFDTQTCSHPGILEERLNILGPSILISTPAHLSRLPEGLPLENLAPHLKKIFSAGSPLSLNASNGFFKALGVRPTEIYGSTETGAIAWREQGGTEEAWNPLPELKVTTSAEGALRLNSPFVQNGHAYDLDDAIHMLPGGRFLLRGRMDRMVKIEEKRLSLPEMEGALERHSWIKSAAVVPVAIRKQGRERQTLGAVVAFTPEGNQQLKTEGRSKTIQSLRQHLFKHFEDILLPRYWRFVECLPVNERGKVAQEAAKGLFGNITDKESTPVLFPNIDNICHSNESPHEVTLHLHIPSELEHFAGHFAQMPILPGVIQVDWAVHLARAHLKLADELGDCFSTIEKLKFLAPVSPETHLKLHLKWHPQTCCLEFAYSAPHRKYSIGRLLFDRKQ